MNSSGAVNDGESEPLRALIVGMGSIGQRHARNLRSILGERVQLVAYRARRHGPVIGERLRAHTARSVEDEYQIRSFTSLDEALATAPDVAFVCNPTSLHLDVAIRCALAGCDLFIEKPVSHTIAGLDRLVATVQENRLVVAVGCQLRFHPALCLLKETIEEGSLGRPLAVRAEVGEYLPGWHPYEDYRSGYAARSELGGGVLLTLIHEIDYLTWLFGSPRRVFALGGHLSSLEVNVEDVASILMDCGRGAARTPVHLQLDYLRRPPRRTCSVLADEGSVDLDLRANRLTRTSVDGTVTTLFDDESLERNNLFMAELTEFLEACRLRRQPRVPLGAGIDVLRIALAARESIGSGNSVEIQ